MKKVLITGYSGFVSGYMVKALLEHENSYKVIGLTRKKSFDRKADDRVEVIEGDLNDRKNLREVLQLVRPDYIIHLASDSSVSYSWEDPVKSFQNNTNIFLNLVEGIRLLKLPCRIISVGSSEEYGLVDPQYLPLCEDAPLNPISPYAVARVSQELLSKIYAQGYGIDVIMTRSFNHIGPGQRENFVISSFAQQIAKIKKGLATTVTVGNLDVVRDFLDVRDVVKAYVLLMEKGKKGEVYNICSGEGYSLKDILLKMMRIAGIKSEYEIDPSLIRPADNPIIIGQNKKLSQNCNWQPSISIEESLTDIINEWAKELEFAL